MTGLQPSDSIDGAGETGVLRVLAVDDESEVLRVIEVVLCSEGFEVVTAQCGPDALRVAHDEHPDVVLLDLMMPGIDGFEVCRRLRREHGGSGISVLLVTGMTQSEDLIRGFEAGADDYIVKPFDPTELVARVRGAARRANEMTALNPLTGLPGNVQIEREVRSRLEQGLPIALLYADLDRFKAFNDRYGFLRGDRVIEYTADVLLQAGRSFADAFVGHIGGDDFVVLTSPAVCEPLARRAISAFDRGVARFYDVADRARGGVEVADRAGRIRFQPVMSLSIGIASTRHRSIRDHRRLIELATEMKSVAKRRPGSTFAMDERKDAITLDGDADGTIHIDPVPRTFRGRA